MQILVVDIGGTWIKYACMTENMDILNRGEGENTAEWKRRID